MAKNDSTNSENILVKVDQNNLIYIDPNSVLEDGIVKPRGTNAENFVYYINLEADLVPRTILNMSNGNENTLTPIARGTLNLLQNKGSDYLDSNWTEVYTNQPEQSVDKNGNPVYQTNTDPSGQSFGISSVQIVVKGANFIPYVNITFIDVRGKTLFENPIDSPYAAFFHIPWPIFYLTVKGYYGKAIRYRLHLVSFNTAYNDANGNFECTAKFVGSTYAYLNDISLTSILNSPYMYGIEVPTQESVNTETGEKKIKLSKSSRGYQTLVSVYDEYRRKGLITIPPDQNPTLREVITKAKRLDQILERQIFGEGGIVDMKLFGLLKEFDDQLLKFYREVKSWEAVKVTKEFATVNNIKYFYLVKTENGKTDSIIGQKSGTLELIIDNNKKQIEKIQNAISEVGRYKKGKDSFNNFTINIKNPIQPITSYYEPDLNGKIGVATELLLDEINEIIKTFNEEKKKLQDVVEEKMNNIIKSKGNEGLGFEPTIRNVFGVLLAGADTYIRLMSNVHLRAYNNRDERSQLLNGFSDETTSEGAIYPWPEVKKETADQTKVLAYPGDPDLVRKLGSDNATLWPEVEFVEEFMAVSQNITDNLAEKERTFDNVTYTFDNSGTDDNGIKKTSQIDVLSRVKPFSDKTFASIIYEIFERIRYSTLHETFTTETSLNELANKEFETLKESIKEDYYLVDILREINTIGKMKEYLQSFSPFERYPYYQDGLATVPYIKDVLSESFELTYSDDVGKEYSQEYEKLSSNLLNYEVEDYRLNIYPFNSTTYLNTQFKSGVTKNDMSLRGVYKVTTSNGFISTDIDSKEWVKSNRRENMFTEYIGIGDELSSIFNTPYFHKSIYQDFFKTQSYGKYKSSSYLLLNSLPFLDLDQDIKTKDGFTVKISNMFKEVGSTHYIPFHLIAKWGSMYHRYKTFLLDGVDIMSGVTTPIDGSVYFDGNTNLTFSGITRSTQDKIGLHPYYSSIFHQVINDYLYYDVTDTTPSSFESAITNDIIKIDSFTQGEFTYYNSFVDNSKFDAEDKRFTILPSHGSNLRVSNLSNNPFPYSTDFDKSEQYNFIIDWVQPQYDEFTYTGVTFPSYNEYLTKNLGSRNNQVIDINTNNKKVIDLIATFSPQVLNAFEEVFLDFASESINTYEPSVNSLEYTNEISVNNIKFRSIEYSKFQDILKALFSVEKLDDDDLSRVDRVARAIASRQVTKQKNVTEQILSTKNNLIKLTTVNPKGLDLNILYGYVGVNQNQRSADGQFQSSQLIDNSKYIELYVGEDIDGFYTEFFSLSNIELNESNVIDYKFLIHIYSGWRQSGNAANKTDFINYLNQNIVLPHSARESFVSTRIFGRMSELKRSQDNNNNLGIIKSFGQEPLKLEVYNNFKLFNDRWTAGNSIGQRLIMEEFLFLDKANRDIGDDLFFDVQKLIILGETESQNLRLYNAISQLLSRNNLDLRALPAYINFYGNNTSKTKIKGSESIASLMFGKFLDVDIEYSTPKMIIQYVGKPSTHIDTSTISKSYRFKNDTCNVGDTNNNPLLITDPNYFQNTNLNNSNKVVAFEVSFGDQNQGIFKSIRLDQSQFKSTFESNIATERLAKSESGSGIAQVDTQLYDIYKVRSYTCEVTCMGNVMIQPTMYFQLKNVPLFEGAYWIVEVSHRIENNGIQTTFTGVRIPKDSLPNPKESFTASYRILYDKIMNSAIKKIASTTTTTTDEVVTTDKGTFKTDRGDKIIDGEKLLAESGVDTFGIPYNGYGNKKTIQKVSYKGSEWYRSIVSKFEGGDDIVMALPTKLSSDVTVNPSTLKFSELKKHSKYYYRLDFDIPSMSNEIGVTKTKLPKYLMFNANTDFLNPLNGRSKTIKSENNLDSTYVPTRYVDGPVDFGSKILTLNGVDYHSGIAVSPDLAKDLRLNVGDVLYFKIR